MIAASPILRVVQVKTGNLVGIKCYSCGQSFDWNRTAILPSACPSCRIPNSPSSFDSLTPGPSFTFCQLWPESNNGREMWLRAKRPLTTSTRQANKAIL